jgi:predicted acyltransferase (DUF342 family)
VNWAAAVWNATNGTPEDFNTKLIQNPYSPSLGTVSLEDFVRLDSNTTTTEIWARATASLAGNTYVVVKHLGNYSQSGDDTPPGVSKFALSSINQDVAVVNQGNIIGSIAGLDVTLENQVNVSGNVVTAGNLVMVNQSEIKDNPNTNATEGNVCVEGNLIMQNQTTITGNAAVHGNATLGSNSATIKGNLVSGQNVILGNGAQIEGNVDAIGDVILGSSNSIIQGNVQSGGIVTVEQGSEIWGNVQAAGGVILKWGATIHGSVLTMGNIDMHTGGNTIKGDATAQGDIILGWDSKIQGNALSNTTIEPPLVSPSPPPSCVDDICPPRLFDLNSISNNGQTFNYRIDTSPNITLDWQQDSTQPISPGFYGNLVLNGKNDIYLTVGEYYFRSIIGGGTKPRIHLDLSEISSSPYNGINVFVQQGVTFGDGLEFHIRTTPNGPYIPMLDNQGGLNIDPNLAAYFYIESGQKFIFNNQGEWFGTILASGDGSDAILFNNHNYLLGSYHAINGKPVGSNQMTVYYVAPWYAFTHTDQWGCQ